MDHPDAPAFARSLTGSKRTNRVEARVADELKFDLQKKCHELAMSESDYIDRLLSVALYGFEHVRSMELHRIQAVCGLSGLDRQSVGAHQ
jgi:hypothetical protein